MATRPRGSGAGGGGGGGGAAPPPNHTQQGSIWPVFEDFKPTSEWKQDKESHILTIQLPGFAKEQLRVSTEGKDVIRVQGERLVAVNKWSRFLEDYKVPMNCDLNSVHAKFQGGGILTITFRKKDTDIPHDVSPPQTTTKDAQKQQPTPQKGQVGSPQPPAVDETPRFRTEQQGLPDVSKDERNTSPLGDAGIILGKRKESNELREQHAAPQRTADTTQKIVEKKETAGTSENFPAEEAAKKKKAKSSSDRAPVTSKSDEDKNNKKSEGKHSLHSIAADYGVSTVEKYKKAVKGYGELNEERKLLVNMGVAVLLVMAVTAYATYKLTLRKDQN